MSIAWERSGPGSDQQIECSGFDRRNMKCLSPISNTLELSAVDRSEFPVMLEDRSCSLSSSSTSSIGKNSDESSVGGAAADGEEVQSEYKGGALDSLDALEEVLPGKKGISMFYNGKSKSFTSLSDAASCSSVKDIVKPENEYTRKRKNLLAFKIFWDEGSNNITRSSRGGMSKRPTSSQSMLTLAALNNCAESNNNENLNSYSSSLGCSLPPLPPHSRRTIFNELSSSPPADKFSSLRSFSLYDLQDAVPENGTITETNKTTALLYFAPVSL